MRSFTILTIAMILLISTISNAQVINVDIGQYLVKPHKGPIFGDEYHTDVLYINYGPTDYLPDPVPHFLITVRRSDCATSYVLYALPGKEHTISHFAYDDKPVIFIKIEPTSVSATGQVAVNLTLSKVDAKGKITHTESYSD